MYKYRKKWIWERRLFVKLNGVVCCKNDDEICNNRRAS